MAYKQTLVRRKEPSLLEYMLSNDYDVFSLEKMFGELGRPDVNGSFNTYYIFGGIRDLETCKLIVKFGLNCSQAIFPNKYAVEHILFDTRRPDTPEASIHDATIVDYLLNTSKNPLGNMLKLIASHLESNNPRLNTIARVLPILEFHGLSFNEPFELRGESKLPLVHLAPLLFKREWMEDYHRELKEIFELLANDLEFGNITAVLEVIQNIDTAYQKPLVDILSAKSNKLEVDRYFLSDDRNKQIVAQYYSGEGIRNRGLKYTTILGFDYLEIKLGGPLRAYPKNLNVEILSMFEDNRLIYEFLVACCDCDCRSPLLQYANRLFLDTFNKPANRMVFAKYLKLSPIGTFKPRVFSTKVNGHISGIMMLPWDSNENFTPDEQPVSMVEQPFTEEQTENPTVPKSNNPFADLTYESTADYQPFTEEQTENPTIPKSNNPFADLSYESTAGGQLTVNVPSQISNSVSDEKQNGSESHNNDGARFKPKTSLFSPSDLQNASGLLKQGNKNTRKQPKKTDKKPEEITLENIRSAVLGDSDSDSDSDFELYSESEYDSESPGYVVVTLFIFIWITLFIWVIPPYPML